MGVTKFSGSTGYRGIVRIQTGDSTRDGSLGTLTPVLATSGSFTMAHQPIYSTGVWGAGYMNASERVAYANDIARLEGSFGLEYSAVAGSTAVTKSAIAAVKAMCFTYRGNKYGTYIQILPNGKYGFQGFSWATSISFSASQGQVVNGDVNWTSYLDGDKNKIMVDSDDSDSEINTAYGAVSTNDTAAGVVPPLDYNGLYPYWGTDIITGTPNGDSTTWDTTVTPDIISWSASCDSPIEVLKCCGVKSGTYVDNLDDSAAPLAPDYLGLGPMSATCQMEIFKLAGDFSDSSLHGRKAFRFVMHTPKDGAYDQTNTYTGANTYIIQLPRVVCNNKSSQIQQGAGWITGSFQFDAIGDFRNPPLGLLTVAEATA